MRKQDHLLQLIGSLSPSEKRYFKIFTSIQPGDKGYIRLFDALENKQSYDAKALCKELEINDRQLKNYKYYLSRAVLKSLESNFEPSEKIAVFKGHLEALLLIDRRQYNYALELTDKLIDKAVRNSMFAFLPSLIALKQGCLYNLQRDEEIPTLTGLLKEYNEAASEFFELSQLMFLITGLERTRKLSKEAFDNPILNKSVNELKSLKAKIFWFDIKTRYVMFYESAEAFLDLMKAEVALYESNPDARVVEPMTYVHSYAKVARAEMKVGNNIAALPWLEKFNALLDKPPAGIHPEKAKALKVYGYYNTSMLLRSLGRYKEALPLAEKSCKELGEGYPYERISYMFEYAVALFDNGQLKQANDILNELMQLNTDMRSDLQLLVRPLMILIQFELGNKDLIPFMIKSARAWLKRINDTTGDISKFFSLLNAMSKANRTELTALLLQLKAAEQANEIGYLSGANIDLAYWIEQQLAKNKRG